MNPTAAAVFLFLIATIPSWAQPTSAPKSIPSSWHEHTQQGPEKRDLESQLHSDGARQRKAMQGFMGVRGKKFQDMPYPPPSSFYSTYGGASQLLPMPVPMQEDAEDVAKRAPSGFFGMRGKKAPAGFIGMRGKKAPSGFLGMRGKKSDEELLEAENEQNAPWEWSHNLANILAELRQQEGSDGPNADAIDEQSLHYLIEANKRAPSGFLGMRGKRQADWSSQSKASVSHA